MGIFLEKDEGSDNSSIQSENQCETATCNLLQWFIETLELIFKWYEHLKSVFGQFSFILCSGDLDCLLNFKYRLKRLYLGSSEFLQLHSATRCFENKH